MCLMIFSTAARRFFYILLFSNFTVSEMRKNGDFWPKNRHFFAQVHGKCSIWPKIGQKMYFRVFSTAARRDFWIFCFFPILRQPKCAEAAILGKILKNWKILKNSHFLSKNALNDLKFGYKMYFAVFYWFPEFWKFSFKIGRF